MNYIFPMQRSFALFILANFSSLSKEPEFLLKYQKNLALLKDSLKIPGFMTNWNEFVIRSPLDLKCLFCKKSIFIVWLITAYEHIVGTDLLDFENVDWICLTQFFSNCDDSKLKFQFFSQIGPQICTKAWSFELDNILKFVISKLYPNFFKADIHQQSSKISWSKVSFEVSQYIKNYKFFKNAKQCKERWFNHLNPFLNKDHWTLDEDLNLLTLSLSYPKKWAKIARSFRGRNQHQIKNRFICLLTKELELSNVVIRSFINKNETAGLVREVLNKLQERKQMEIDSKIDSFTSIDEFIDFQSEYHSLPEDF